MIRTVYVETSIPSMWADPRPESAERRAVTREWWSRHRGRYDVWSSRLATEELRRGDYPWREEAIECLAGVPFLDVSDDVLRVAALFRRHRLAPEKDPRDAVHMAFASVYRIDCLLSWNCRHLANANKAVHLRVVCEREGLWTPILATPEQLWPEEE